MAWFKDNERTDVQDAIQVAGLNQLFLRPQLFDQVHTGWFGTLLQVPAPLYQLTGDLQSLDNQDRLVDGTVPVVLYLGNAARLAESAGHSDPARVLRQVHDRIAAAAQFAPEPELPDLDVHEEFVIHQPDFLPVLFLETGAQRTRAVARIEVQRVFNGEPRWVTANTEPEIGLGTGWLVAPGMLLTCWHVIKARMPTEGAAAPDDWAAQASRTTCRFDYESQGAAGTTTAVAEVLSSDETLDYALLRLHEADPARGWFARAESVVPQSPVNIIQHPDGRPMEIVVRNNMIHESKDTRLRYFTDTQGGSSGAPVCDDAWAAVALHRAGRSAPPGLRYNGKQTAYVNEGTLLSRVWEHLPADVRDGITTATQPN